MGSHAYTEKHLVNRLVSKYGDNIVVATSKSKNKPTVVCFKGSKEILTEKWYSERDSNIENERMRIVQTAADIIMQDIQGTVFENETYPSRDNFFENIKFRIPNT